MILTETTVYACQDALAVVKMLAEHSPSHYSSCDTLSTRSILVDCCGRGICYTETAIMAIYQLDSSVNFSFISSFIDKLWC